MAGGLKKLRAQFIEPLPAIHPTDWCARTVTGESAKLTVDVGFAFVNGRKLNIVHSRNRSAQLLSVHFLLHSSSLLDSYRTSIKTAHINIGISQLFVKALSFFVCLLGFKGATTTRVIMFVEAQKLKGIIRAFNLKEKYLFYYMINEGEFSYSNDKH